MSTYIPRTGEPVRIVAVEKSDRFPNHAPSDVVTPTVVIPCRRPPGERFPVRCIPGQATCVYIRTSDSLLEGTWCIVEPVRDGITDHALLWRRALCNAVRAAMQGDTELVITWLEAAQALEDVCPEYAGVASAIAVKSGLALHECSGELR